MLRRRPARDVAPIAFTGIVLLSIAIRPLFTMLSPIADRVGEDVPLSTGTLSLLGALPPIAFAATGLVTPRLAARWGVHGPAAVALGVIAAGEVGRALVSDTVSFVVCSAVGFAGIGVANVLLPALVKRHFPSRIVLLTAIGGAGTAIGATVPAALVSPIAQAADWRLALGCWAAIAIAAALPWIALIRRERGERARPDRTPLEALETPRAEEVGRVARSGLAWVLLAQFSVGQLLLYTAFAWLPAILADRAGVPADQTGLHLAAFAAMGLVSNFLLAATGRGSASPVWYIHVAAASGVVGLLGLILAPAAAPWLWTLTAGLGTTHMHVTMMLIGLRTRTEHAAVSLSAFVQGPGYLLGALGPLGAGALHEATADWTIPLVLLAAVESLAVLCALSLRGGRTVEDGWLPRVRQVSRPRR